MYKLEVGKLLGYLAGLSNLAGNMPDHPNSPQFFAIENHEDLKRMSDFVLNELKNLNMPVSSVSAEYLREVIWHGGSNWSQPVNGMAGPFHRFVPLKAGKIKHYINELNSRFKDEMNARAVYVVTRGNSSFTDAASEPFGAEVARKFSTMGAFEIDEAAKCLALERPTAAVFHLMRVLEIAIKSIKTCLAINIATNNPNWGQLLNSIKQSIESRSSAIPSGWSSAEDERFFREIHLTLDSVRNVWRNPTMHVEYKYTLEEAENIYGAVRSFMKKLAVRLDDQGLPLA